MLCLVKEEKQDEQLTMLKFSRERWQVQSLTQLEDLAQFSEAVSQFQCCGQKHLTLNAPEFQQHSSHLENQKLNTLPWSQA